MEYRAVFKRHELKYLMDSEQAEAVQEALEEHLVPDRYWRSTVRNVYYDIPDYLLARRSIERPMYKEKLRLRSYGAVSDDDEVFVELKKKYDSVVYKRRLAMGLSDAEAWLRGDAAGPGTQIGEEIGFMTVRYPGIRPAMLLSYEREAHRSEDGDLRITIDRDILARTEDVRLSSDLGGSPVLPEGYTLMEVKTMYGYPGWLTSLLCAERLYKSSFTKYGNAYKEMVLGKMPEEFFGLSRAAAAQEAA